MQETTIPQSAFTEGRLDILTSATLEVRVFSQQGQVVEQFPVFSGHHVLQLTTQIADIDHVAVSIVTGQEVMFHPVIKAL